MNDDGEETTWDRLCAYVEEDNRVEREKEGGALQGLFSRPWTAIAFLAGEIDHLRAVTSVGAAGMDVVEANNARLVGLLEDTILPMAKDLKELRVRVEALEDIVEDLQHGKATS